MACWSAICCLCLLWLAHLSSVHVVSGGKHTGRSLLFYFYNPENFDYSSLSKNGTKRTNVISNNRTETGEMNLREHRGTNDSTISTGSYKVWHPKQMIKGGKYDRRKTIRSKNNLLLQDFNSSNSHDTSQLSTYSIKNGTTASIKSYNKLQQDTPQEYKADHPEFLDEKRAHSEQTVKEERARYALYTFTNSSNNSTCHLESLDVTIQEWIVEKLAFQAKLLTYQIYMEGYDKNPLLNTSLLYKPTTWFRASSYQGNSLLALSFNYPILSLWTLTFGVMETPVHLQDHPKGCFGSLSEDDKIRVVVEIFMRDFGESGPPILEPHESICYRQMQVRDQMAHFETKCCRATPERDMVYCLNNQKNIWLRMIDYLLWVVMVVVLAYGPTMAPSSIKNATNGAIPYAVKLTEPLHKKICILKGEMISRVRPIHVIDLREAEQFTAGKITMAKLPTQTVIPIKIDRFDIQIDYGKLQIENRVSVGLKNSLMKAIFQCEIRNVGPFKSCCLANMFSCLGEIPEVPWISLGNAISKLLIVCIVPFLWYFRLFIFYLFEQPELIRRRTFAKQHNLEAFMEFKMLYYLSPTHPFLMSIYFCYATVIIFMVIAKLFKDDLPFKKVICKSFQDLSKLSWLKAVEKIMGHVLWPFDKFGCVGCIVAPIYWVLVIPIMLVFYIFYCTPMVYLLCRTISRALATLLISKVHQTSTLTASHSIRRSIKKRLRAMEHTLLLHQDEHEEWDEADDVVYKAAAIEKLRMSQQSEDYKEIGYIRLVFRLIGVLLILYLMVGTCIISAESMGFYANIVAFSLMGVIVNAASVLKYVSMIILVVLYSYDCYNNVYKKYLKLNKSLFTEVKNRLKDQVQEVTSLPAYLQENRGFKTCENSEQADYETPDDVCKKFPLHWDLNDLILFIDNEDMPRLPVKLFTQVCSIKVAGSPGPVYQSLMQATYKFCTLFFFLLFIFLVVLSFGEAYNISSTNQMLATLAGGFVPFIMRTMMRPSTPDIELSTVSFKSKLDEVIANFKQSWPMYDFTFEVGSAEDDIKMREEEKKKEEEEKPEEKPEIPDVQKQTTLHGTGGSVILDMESAEKFLDAPRPSRPVSNELIFNGPDLGLENSSTHIVFPVAPMIPPVPLPLKATKYSHKPHEKQYLFEPAHGQIVDILIILPETKFESRWHRAWSNMSLYKMATAENRQNQAREEDMDGNVPFLEVEQTAL